MKPNLPPFIRYFAIIASCFLPVLLFSQSQGRIVIRMDEGKARFYHTGTNERFVPRGFNYIQLVNAPTGPFGESQLFHPDTHDPISIDDDFQRMASLGFNVVRVFVDLCSEPRCITDISGFDPVYLDNIVGMLKKAEQYGLYIMLTANWLPDGYYSYPAHEVCEESGDFFGGNCLLLSPKGVENYGIFFRDFVLELQDRNAPMHQIWAYELRNEFFLENNFVPFTKNSGSVTTANGKTYNMSSQQQKDLMAEEAVVYWADYIRDQIKTVDPLALVTCGFFTPNTPNVLRENDPRIVPFVSALEDSDLDFFGIHSYAGFEDFHQEAENYGIIGYVDKPIVLGEYGAFLPNASDEYVAAQLIDHWQADICMYGVEGFTLWTWDRHRTGASNPDDPWAGSDEGAFIAKVISPYNKINSCDILLPNTNVAEKKSTRASMEWEMYTSELVVDGNATQTPWIAGGDPPQWIEVDLGQIYDLESIQLVVETGSDDPHFYTHQIQVRAIANLPYQTIHTFADDRVNFEVITYDPDDLIENVRYVRVFIPQAPGWAALHELRAYIPQDREQFDVPAPPILTYPRPGMDIFEGDELRWKNDMAGLAARLQIAEDRDFENIVDDISGITGDSYDISDLETSERLYWRVKQSNAFGESFWSITGVIDRMTVSINNHFDDLVLKIFPNPAKEKLYFDASEINLNDSVVEIFSLATGQRMDNFILQQVDKTIDISELIPGLYVVSVKGAAMRFTAKFFKL